MQRINRPIIKQVNEGLIKRIVLVLAIIIMAGVFYWLVFARNDQSAGSNKEEQTWYAVKLVNEEVYYGQVADTGADPIIINNVYYSYEQALGEDDASAGSTQGRSESSNNLRLVKRGKETHGPSGSMNIVRSQVLYMESLKQDSKVLQAILDYKR